MGEEAVQWEDSVPNARRDNFKFYKLSDSSGVDFGDDVDIEKYCFGVRGLTNDDDEWTSDQVSATGISFGELSYTHEFDARDCAHISNKCTDGGGTDCYDSNSAAIGCEEGYSVFAVEDSYRWECRPEACLS